MYIGNSSRALQGAAPRERTTRLPLTRIPGASEVGAVEKILESAYRTIPGRNRMHPQQLRHAYQQCGAETDRLAQPAHRTEYLFRLRGRWLATVVGVGE